MTEFKETRRQTGIQKKHNTGQKGSEKKTKNLLGQICYKFRTRNVQNRTESVQNFKTNIEETARLQGNRRKCIPSIL